MNSIHEFPNVLRRGRIACALCGKKAKLCESHIIPEFAYKPIYGENHRFVQLSQHYQGGFLQKGIREELLCQNCEQHIQKYEDYAAKMFTGKTGIRRWDCEYRHENSRLPFIYLARMDYVKFKLFALSVLWRASVSKHPFFKEVDLGSHENRVAWMIRTENPGTRFDYPFFCSEVYLWGKGMDQVMLCPGKSPCEQERYSFFYAGWGGVSWKWTHYLGKQYPEMKGVRKFLPNENGQLTVFMEDFEETPYYSNFVEIIRKP